MLGRISRTCAPQNLRTAKVRTRFFFAGTNYPPVVSDNKALASKDLDFKGATVNKLPARRYSAKALFQKEPEPVVICLYLADSHASDTGRTVKISVLYDTKAHLYKITCCGDEPAIDKPDLHQQMKLKNVPHEVNSDGIFIPHYNYDQLAKFIADFSTKNNDSEIPRYEGCSPGCS